MGEGGLKCVTALVLDLGGMDRQAATVGLAGLRIVLSVPAQLYRFALNWRDNLILRGWQLARTNGA